MREAPAGARTSVGAISSAPRHRVDRGRWRRWTDRRLGWPVSGGKGDNDCCRSPWSRSSSQRPRDGSKMILRSRAAQTAVLAIASALAFMTAEVGDHAHAEGNLDASNTISFARIPVGEITATGVFGASASAISARARAVGVMKVLSVDGEGSFSTHGTIKDGHPVPTNFTSKIVSNTETSDVTMVLDEGNVNPKRIRGAGGGVL